MAWWLFQHVVVTAGLALAVAAVSRAARIGPVARHALWLVVLVKLITPPVIEWPWAAPDPLRVAALDQRDALTAVRDGSAAEYNAASAAERGDAVVTSEPGALAVTEAVGSPPDSAMAAVWPWAIGIWIAGSLMLATVEGLRLIRLSRRVRVSAPAGSALDRRVAALSARIGLRPVEVRVVPGSSPPAVWGFGRAQLLWPADLPADVSEPCVDGLLLHELAHVRRRDHLVGWIELAAGVVWWWNPLFWYVRSSLREQAELACDAWVTSALPNGRRAYAESLLALSGAAVPGLPSMAVVGIRPTTRRMLERRLVMIMQGRAPVRLTRVGLLSLALVAAATLPAWATAQNPPPPLPPVPPAAVPIAAAPPAALVLMSPVTPRATQVANGQIHGRVTDQSGDALAGVQVMLESDAMVRSMVDVTATSGRYEFPIVPVGTYTVSFELAGFKRVVRANVIIQTGFHAEVNARLGPPEAAIPPEGQQLVDRFQTARDQIQREADQRIEAQRQALIGALEALLDQYTKAGRLDEAVAIRDFLRSGLPGGGVR
jgi:beta-lactamase regulating signal transducer with metallopeptidase domain